VHRTLLGAEELRGRSSRGATRVPCQCYVAIHELADRLHDESCVIPHRHMAATREHVRLDTRDLALEAGRVTLSRQDAIELGRCEQHGAGDAVEVLQR
jgi:hypothetical protein